MKLDLDERYYLLRELERKENQSQRALARQLGFSLGKINFLIGELVKKGFVKMESFAHSRNKAQYRYILTPRGIREKMRVTRAFIGRKEREYEKICREIEEAKEAIGN